MKESKKSGGERGWDGWSKDGSIKAAAVGAVLLGGRGGGLDL